LIILGVSLPHEIPPVVANDFIPAVASLDTARLLSTAAQQQGRTVRIHIKVDTGMGRFGLALNGAAATVRAIAELPGLELDGIFSHFPAAGTRDRATLGQVCDLSELIAVLAADGIRFRLRHLANSTAVAAVPEACREPFNMVRAGIDLHGGNLPIRPRPYETEPVLTLRARLLTVRRMPRGATIGYGRTYKVEEPAGERVGVVSIGYADGFPRSLSNKGAALVRGVRCPVLGIVCMDYTMISLRAVPDATAGDEVTLIGSDGPEAIAISDVALAAQTIPYELMCGLGARVQRHYVEE
jgi:alanine racemase